MEQPAYLDNELKETAPFLAGLQKNNVFSVPENYFTSLPATILKKIVPQEVAELPFLKPPFTVPDGYFDSLAVNILQKIQKTGEDDVNSANQELKLISPLLHSAKNANIFSVPPGYFENFPATLLSVVHPPAKVIELKKRSIVWHCLAAAMLTGVMAISALWISNVSIKQGAVTADISRTAGIKDALQYKSQQQINLAIADLPETDIVKYLEATGSNTDDEALASGISEKDLPDELDYLSNENTLQIFLAKTGTNNKQN